MYKCHLPDPTKEQTRTSQRVAIERPKSSHARCRDEEDDDDGIDDPTYEQDELTGSQLANAP